MPELDAEPLRLRARALRNLGATLEACLATRLHLRAGADTWIGPSPQRCLDDLLTARRRLRHAADQLAIAAIALDRRADAVDAEARMQQVVG
jgi:hypothetical protein